MIRLAAAASVLVLAGCGGVQLAPPGMPTIAEIQTLQAQTAAIQDVQAFYVDGLTLTQQKCGTYWDAAVMASLQSAQTQGQVALLSGLAAGLMGLGNVPTPYTTGAGLGGSFLSAALANQQTNSLAGNRPAGLATLTAAAQQALINAAAEPRSGADAWAALYAVYRACSPSGIEALKQQAIDAAANHLVVTGGQSSSVPSAARDLAPTRQAPSRALPMVRVR